MYSFTTQATIVTDFLEQSFSIVSQRLIYAYTDLQENNYSFSCSKGFNL